jgi:hypothetical protein
MNGSNARFLETFQGIFQVPDFVVGGCGRASDIQLETEPKPEFTCSFAREGHGYDAVHGSPARPQNACNAPHQLGRFTSTCGGFDNQCLIECGSNPLPRDLICFAHGMLRS